jgi:hypothetical protein
VRVTLPESYGEVVAAHGDWVAREVLAVELTVGSVDELLLAKAEDKT